MRRAGLAARAALLMVALAAPRLGAGPAAAQEPTPAGPGGEEAFVSVRYRDLVDEVLSARFRDDSLYVPVGGLLSALGINYSIDPQRHRVSGFLGQPDQRYLLDFDRGEGRFRQRRLALPDSAFIASDVEFYVLPSVLGRLLGLGFNVDLRSLQVRVDAVDPLPVAEAAARARRHARLEASPLIRPPAPLRFPRAYATLRAGMAQYQLTTLRSAAGTQLDAGLGAAALVLNGELQARTLIGVDGGPVTLSANSLRWRYVFDRDTLLVRQVTLGRLFSGGLRIEQLDGAEVSNRRPQPRSRFGSDVIVGPLPAGWEVELYVGDQLVAFARADASGEYRLSVPVVYGTSLLTLRFYGPNGEIREEHRRVQIPYSVLPAERAEYDVAAGRLVDAGAGTLSANLAWGATDWITPHIGMEWLGPPIADHPVVSAGATARVGDVILDGSAAPGTLYTLEAVAYPGTQSSYDIGWSHFAGPSYFNLSGLRREMHLDLFQPVALGRRSLGLRLFAEGRWQIDGPVTFDTRADATLNLVHVKASLGYRRSWLRLGENRAVLQDEVRLGALHVLQRMPPGLRALDGTLLAADLGWGLRRRRPSTLRFDASRSVGRHGRAGIGVEHDALTRVTRGELRLTFDLPTARTYTYLQTDGSSSIVSQSVSGAVGYDPVAADAAFSGREWLGRAAASFRLFVDENGNGARDPGEPLLTPRALRFRQPLRTQVGADSVLRTTDLLAYARYDVDLDPSHIPNPLWVPPWESFSFVTDPAVYRRIDVPFSVAGVVSGTVRARTSNGNAPLPGLRVRLRKSDGDREITLTTFSDGTFYQMGIPPGDYLAAPDSAQLAALGASSEPGSRSFTVHATADGDVVEGIDFTVEIGETPGGPPTKRGAPPPR